MKPKRKILIAGPHRTGSTAIYNLTRVICGFYGRVYCCFEDQYDPHDGSKYDFEIVKAHKWNEKWPNWAEVIITTYRDPADIWASMQRFSDAGGYHADGRREFERQDVCRGLAWLAHYAFYANYFISFPQIDRCPEKLAQDISFMIGVKIRPPKIVEIWKAIKPPEKGFDPVTLLHANHITK